MKVVWSVTALGRLTAIYEFIAKDLPRYATRIVERLTTRSQQIVQYPESGEIVPEYVDPNIRELLEGAYRVIHRLEESRIVVLSVVHGARLLPPTQP